MTSISLYTNVKQVKTDKTIPMDIFLDGIREGSWQDVVLPIRVIQDEKLRAAAKQKAPCVTIGGTFKERTDSGLIQHSGYIAIDIDDVDDVNHLKSLLCADKYVYAAFVSISGRGLCLIFKINPAKHRESFQGISEYLYENYKVIADPTSINVSRLRFVSYDPFIYIAGNVEKFVRYPKNKPPKKIEKVIYAKDDFEQILEQIQSRRLNLCENYHEWLRIGFSFVHQFGEAGREYFHQISQYSSKYDGATTDKQYTSCLKHKGTNPATIATFYYYCKSAGIQLYSEKTRKIIATASSGKKGGLKALQVAENLKKFEGIEDTSDIVTQVFNNDVKSDETLIESVRTWIKHNYDLKRNLITRKIEDNGKELGDIEMNTMFLECKIVFDKLTFELFLRILFSNLVPSYNPVKDYLESIQWDGKKRLDAFGGCINSDTGTLAWRCRMVQKWIVGVVSGIYGETNELNLILVGGKNTGKTQFFKRLLPKELSGYFGLSQLDRGKDDEILMCEMIIILNDEYGGKNKPDARNEKRLMAADKFNLRVPYGKGNETIQRLSSLCGTCNSIEVLDDPTGNRRIIVMEAAGKFDFAFYNSIDKQQLFAEALQLYKNGERPVLDDEDILELEENTDKKFSKVSIAGEMIHKYFLPPSESTDFMTTTEVLLVLEIHTRTGLNTKNVGEQLRYMGYKRHKHKGAYGYVVSKKPVELSLGNITSYPKIETEDLPF